MYYHILTNVSIDWTCLCVCYYRYPHIVDSSMYEALDEWLSRGGQQQG